MGLPSAPPSAKTAPVQSAFVTVAPPPDPNVATEIKQQTQEADQAEREVASAAVPSSSGVGALSPPPPSAPMTVSLGQTADEVAAVLGPPKSIVKLGAKEIYVYQDMKITFKGGKVSDVQ